MFIADTHSDTLFALGVEGKKDVMITPERLREGGVTLQVFAMFSGSKGNKGDYEAIARAEYAQVPGLIEAGLRQVTHPAEAKDGEYSFMLSIEGCEVFEKGLSAVQDWYDKGVRMAALVWNNPNSIGFPAKGGSKEGLTPYGFEVVREMQRLGMAVDTSHLNEAGFYDLFAKTDKPPMASHSCCTALRDHFRNLTDDQLRLMIREGGYVGVNFYPNFLTDTGRANISDVANHIDHICQLGGAGIVGFGSDFDGIECTPEGLEHPGHIPALLDALRARGYDEKTICGIAGENLVAYYNRIS